MAHSSPRNFGPLAPAEARELARVVGAGQDVTIFVDGTVHRLRPDAVDAVLDLLRRLSAGDAVTLSSMEEVLTTSQAAELAGISHTYLRNMTDRGEIPVQYRGSHRRILRRNILAWLEAQKLASGGGSTETVDPGSPE
jgi:excisionase family DNA binding protein